MTKFGIVILLAGMMLFLAGMAAANAQPSGSGVEISGDVSITASANLMTNVGLGVGTTTDNALGSIREGSSVAGSVDIRAASGAQTAVALSPGGSARTEVATIDSAQIGGSASVQGAVGSATAITVLPGSSTCVAVGSVGPGAYGPVATAAAAGNVLAIDLGLFTTSRVQIGGVGHAC